MAVLQYMLALVAEFEPTVSAVRIDGVYGGATARAVREYQSHTGLPSGRHRGPPDLAFHLWGIFWHRAGPAPGRDQLSAK